MRSWNLRSNPSRRVPRAVPFRCRRAGAAIAGAFLLLFAHPARLLAFDYENEFLQLELGAGFSIEEIHATYGTTSADEVGSLHLLGVPEGTSVWEVLGDMEGDSRIVWAEPSYLNSTPEALRAMVVGVVGGTVEDYEDQDAYTRLRLDFLHERATGAGAIIAVLDTGVNGDHPALLGHVLPGYDFVDDDEDASDSANGLDDDLDHLVDEGAGHGTMVAGIGHLAAPDADILPVRVLDDEGTGRTFDVVKGVLFAIEQGADVINLSIGLRTPCEMLAHGVELALASGLVVVAAAGNDGAEFPPFYPASLPGVHGVAALDSADVKASFASYHSTVSVSAPGDGIRAPFLDGGWAIGAGSSFAAPFVAGQAAVVRGFRPGISRTTADSVIRAGVTDVYEIEENAPYIGKLGSGRLDGLETWRALQLVAETESSSVPGAGDPGASRSKARFTAAPSPLSPGSELRIVLQDHGTAADSALDPWSIVDPSGRVVGTVEPRRIDAHTWTASWRGEDRQGAPLPAGHYFLIGPRGVSPARLLLLR